MLQKFLMKKMLKSQLKGVPEDQQDKLLAMIDKNPQLFMNIAKEVQQKMKSEGKDQMTAMMDVMKKYQSDLKKAMKEADMEAAQKAKEVKAEKPKEEPKTPKPDEGEDPYNL